MIHPGAEEFLLLYRGLSGVEPEVQPLLRVLGEATNATSITFFVELDLSYAPSFVKHRRNQPQCAYVL